MLRTAALLLSCASVNGLSEQYVTANSALLWANFKDQHRKSYSAAEESHRYAVFIENMKEAAQLEKKNPRAQFGSSKFADLTKEEFKSYHNMAFVARDSPPAMFSSAEVQEALATSVDWRSKGAVVQVKDQKQCGSCWSFSSTGGIEGAWFLAGNTLTSVSEQELVSCDKIDSGCNGGLMDNAYQWLVSSKGGNIVTEESYPYTSGEGDAGSCQSLSGKPVGATITGHTDVTHTEEQMAAYMLKNGPLPIAVDAQSHWQTYTGGVVSDCDGTSLDHGVLAVGYTSEYWVVKNSWGSSWGESGYIRLAFGSNQCGLNQSPIAPIVSHGPSPPTPPSPSSTPAPPSTPAPASGDCLDIQTESACNAAKGGCNWCQYSSFGICTNSDIPCPDEDTLTKKLSHLSTFASLLASQFQ